MRRRKRQAKTNGHGQGRPREDRERLPRLVEDDPVCKWLTWCAVFTYVLCSKYMFRNGGTVTVVRLSETSNHVSPLREFRARVGGWQLMQVRSFVCIVTSAPPRVILMACTVS
jgi:hypothetical protein